MLPKRRARLADPTMEARVDAEGRLVMPPELAARLGLQPGARVVVEQDGRGLRLRRPVTQLAKLYIEPTNRCNLACRTCLRNTWDEPLGRMSEATFARIMDGLAAFSPPPLVFFGGLGEPLTHPHIMEMVAAAKALGSAVELITNGMLLTQELSRRLIAAGLDCLWVSLDGARPESYVDVRLGAALPEVLANINGFRASRPQGHRPTPEIGIAFVAMKRNIADLPDLIRLGNRLGASRFMVTNVLPYTAELRDEVLYSRTLSSITYLPSPWVPHLSLPKLDIDDRTWDALYQALRGGRNVTFAGSNLGLVNDRCPFVESGAAAVGWDGRFSPCLPLLHDHTSFLGQRERISTHFSPGNVTDVSLSDLWEAPVHQAFRERVQRFEFSPCTCCGGCDLSLRNKEDCFGNTFPTCGGCLWAQGIVQCP